METDRLTHVEDASTAKRKLLEYLLSVASKTTGGEVWRALFAELYAKIGSDGVDLVETTIHSPSGVRTFIKRAQGE